MGRLGVSIVAAAVIAGTAETVALQRADPGGAAASVDRRLNVTIGAGNGTVTSSPAGINCPPACSSFFPEGTTVTLTSMPAAGYRSDGWQPFTTCVSQPDEPSVCRVTLGSSDVLVRAIFRPAATLHVFPNGAGVATVSPAGLDLDDEDAGQRTRCDPAERPRGCRLAYLPGTRVTATAAPGGGRTFAGWSDAGCPGGGPCTVEAVEGELSLVATFNPLELAVAIAGEGTVTSTPTGISCTQDASGNTGPACAVAAPRGAQFVLDAGTAPHEWRFGCEPEGGDPRARRCTATVAALPTLVGVAFGGAGGPAPPNRIRVRLDVLKQAAGTEVQGKNIRCREARCTATYRFGDLEELRPVDAASAVFQYWVNGCGTTRVCRFPVGPITSLEAVFGPALRASFVRVRVTGSGRKRAVVARVSVNRAASVSLRLARRGRRVAARTVNVKQGQTPVRLKVPARASAGRHTLTAIVKSGREQRRLVRTVHVRR